MSRLIKRCAAGPEKGKMLKPQAKLKDPYELRLSGSGGQGLILAGIIIAEAAMLDGKNVVQTQSYGPEARLGASRSEVIISSKKIANPEVIQPDLLLCLSQDAFNKFFPQIKADTTVVLDSTNVKSDVPQKKIYRFPITEAAVNEVGNKIVANIVSLGVINALENIVSQKNLRRAMCHRIPARFLELNERALEVGEKLVGSSLKL